VWCSDLPPAGAAAGNDTLYWGTLSFAFVNPRVFHDVVLMKIFIKVQSLTLLSTHACHTGTYRSNLYFGARTRSPQSPLVGLMWFGAHNPLTVDRTVTYIMIPRFKDESRLCVCVYTQKAKFSISLV
jgi:hypothetical protein